MAGLRGGAPDLGARLVEDIHWGGAVMWIGGDGLMLVVMLVVMSGWLAAPQEPRRARAAGSKGYAAPRWLAAATARAAAAAISGSADVDEDSAALDAYNTMLARLAREVGDQRQDPD